MTYDSRGHHSSRTPTRLRLRQQFLGVIDAEFRLDPIAKRVTLGLGRLGSISGDSSGDIFIAFSTANVGAGLEQKKVVTLQMLPNDRMDALFEASVQATEEAVANALVAAKTMTGADSHTVEALPHDRLREVLKKYNRLADTK